MSDKRRFGSPCYSEQAAGSPPEIPETPEVQPWRTASNTATAKQRSPKSRGPGKRPDLTTEGGLFTRIWSDRLSTPGRRDNPVAVGQVPQPGAVSLGGMAINFTGPGKPLTQAILDEAAAIVGIPAALPDRRQKIFSSDTSSTGPRAASSTSRIPTSRTLNREATPSSASTNVWPRPYRSTARLLLRVHHGGWARCWARTSSRRASRMWRTWSRRWWNPSGTNCSACSTSSPRISSDSSLRIMTGCVLPSSTMALMPRRKVTP